MAAGCTGGDGSPGDREDLDLVDDDAPAFAPGVVSFEHELWFDPLAMEIGDFNGDEATDILVVGVEPGAGITAGVFLGDGSGGFDPPFDPGYQGCSAYPVVGDLTGDGLTDVISAGCSNNLNVLEGQPDGTLQPWADWPDINFGPVSSNAVVDFEGDGDADLVSLSVPDSAYIHLTLGNGGHGVWSVETTEIGNPAWSGFGPNGLQAGHFDQDGIVDVALLDREYDVTVLMGTAPANFAFPRELGVAISPWSVRPADMDDDGLTDLVVSSYSDSMVQVLRANWTGGGFIAHGPVEIDGFTPYDTTLADITGEGDIDVAMVSNTIAELYWLEGDGIGGLDSLQRFILPSPAIRIHSGYIDDDDIEDLVVATFDDGSITLVLSNGG